MSTTAEYRSIQVCPPPYQTKCVRLVLIASGPHQSSPVLAHVRTRIHHDRARTRRFRPKAARSTSSCQGRDRNWQCPMRNAPAPERNGSRTPRNNPATQRNRFAIRCALRLLAPSQPLSALHCLGFGRRHGPDARHGAASSRSIATGAICHAGLSRVPPGATPQGCATTENRIAIACLCAPG